MPGKIVSICISSGTGTAKAQIASAELQADFGIVGDGHAGSIRPVSVAMQETADKFAAEHNLNPKPGDFAENILIQGLDLSKLSVGGRIRLGKTVLEVVQIGKETRPDHYSFHGYRLLPQHGYFCRVVSGGTIIQGDECSLEA